MRSKKLMCKQCGAGPFKVFQALGAHNRYFHPKDKRRRAKSDLTGVDRASVGKVIPQELSSQEVEAKQRVKDRIDECFKAAENNVMLTNVQEENWYLRFLLRRGCRIDQDKDVMHHVRLEIVKLEQELAKQETPF